MVCSSNLGFPRIGSKRELKKALESFWAGEISESEFLKQTDKIKSSTWILQRHKKINFIPSNDFSFYDHVLDTVVMVGAIPNRYDWTPGEEVSLKTYFAMARGEKGGVTAMEMTKWFDTNYHYIVPEFEEDQKFCLASRKALKDFRHATDLGVHTHPVLLGPISFLKLGKFKSPRLKFSILLERLLPVYEQVLKELAESGADWVQMDEPCLIQSLNREEQDAFRAVYERLATVSDKTQIFLATYFGSLRENLSLAVSLPVTALHLDLVRAPEQLDDALKIVPDSLILSLGLINGRNVWKSNLNEALKLARRAVEVIGPKRVLVGPSCSLMFSPVDLDSEANLDKEIKYWLAFAVQKLDEISILKSALNDPKSVERERYENQEVIENRRNSKWVQNQRVKSRLVALTNHETQRRSGYLERHKKQKLALRLPMFPTTTIGSFAQTDQVRSARADHKAGRIDDSTYEQFLKGEIKSAIEFQEEVNIDVLVHGEFERNDMVEYFGEQLEGFIHTKNGWVQSYGSRCVKPPLIFGDVSRSEPMTVRWWKYAQSCTNKPVKGMLTGPVTILQWSFVRDDQPRSVTAKQIAFALRDEVADLEKAGARIIQIDEPALREGLPLRREDWTEYLTWAVESFRIASCGVSDETQIHTHMCYSEFNDIIQAISDLDADVISIETSRSQMELLNAFSDFKYPNEIGPGVYDIHSPRVPTEDEMYQRLYSAIKVLSPEQVWVNPDCGLKTRKWEEIKPSLLRMTAAAARLRQEMRARQEMVDYQL